MYTEYTIGRSSSCDIVISNMSISKCHAEFVITSNGRFFLTDRCSSSGTYVLADVDRWERIKQSFIELKQPLMFGDWVSDAEGLVSLLRVSNGLGNAESLAEPMPGDTLPTGQVRRDPVTGEIVSMRGE